MNMMGFVGQQAVTGGGPKPAISIIQEKQTATTGDHTSDSTTMASTATSGNLLIMVGGFRDTGNDALPAVSSLTSGWTLGPVAATMEYHICFLGWKVSDGTEATAGYTSTGTVNSGWLGLIEFSAVGVSNWGLDTSNVNGSNTSNVGSIVTGSTGTLDANALIGVVVGTSRTNNDGLSLSGITGLTAFTNGFLGSYDAAAANFITEYWEVPDASTAAQEATVSESSGNSRMGAVIGVFKSV